MKLKGQTVRTKKREYVLKDQLGEGGFSIIYSTNDPDIICKVQMISMGEIAAAYKKEKEMLSSYKHTNIVVLHDSIQTTLKDSQCGLLFLENCNAGTAFNLLEKFQGSSVPEKTVLKIFEALASVLEHLHHHGIAHRDIKMENMLINSKGEFRLCDFGSASKEVIKNIDNSNRVELEEWIEKTTTPIYRSPEMLDLYSGLPIGPKVDIFAMGCLIFMLCYQKPPFESRLSAINKQYFLPEQNFYSEELVEIIEACFTTNPNDRPSAKIIKQRVKALQKKKKIQLQINLQKELELTLQEISRVNKKNLKGNNKTAQSSILDKIKKIYTQITTETQGWIAGFIEDNEEAPPLKYNRSIISKCWEKRYKVEKLYEIVDKYSQENKDKCLVTLKLLILIHNFQRKGPSEAVTFDKEHSAVKICTKVYKNWKNHQKTYNEEDIKRNTFVCLLIRHYSLIIIHKIKLCFENSDVMEANYSIVPFLSNPKEKIILKLPIIEGLLKFLQHCSQFHEIVNKNSYLTEIQRSIILSIVDEQYCLISTLVFLLAAFKYAIPYFKEELDYNKLTSKLTDIETKFEQVYRKLAQQFVSAQKLASLFEENQFLLNMEVIGYIKKIPIHEKKQAAFNITDHLNYKKNIFGLKIPLTYEEVVKNPNFLKDLESQKAQESGYIELNQFRKENAPKNSPNQTKNSSAFQKKSEVEKVFEVKFQKQSKQKKAYESKYQKTSLMEFTHQNLNKDFGSHIEPKKENHFKDFMSIVDSSYEESNKSASKGGSSKDLNNPMKKKDSPTIVISSNQSKQAPKVQAVEGRDLFSFGDSQKEEEKSVKARVDKMELMNFFEDDDDDMLPEGSQEIKRYDEDYNKNFGSNPVSAGNSAHISMNSDLLGTDFATQSLSKPLEPNHFKSQVQAPNQKDTKVVVQSSPNSMTDLKGFIVEEVKKSAEQYLIEFACLKFKEKVGYGHSSEVFRGEWRGREVAIKKIQDQMHSPNSQKEFRREIMTSVKIRHHPQLVTLIGVAQHDQHYYIINEFCNGATLFDLLHQSHEHLSWLTRINIAKQIVTGMVFLHTNDPPIIHRDLKSLNVLVSNKFDYRNPDHVQIKIADFGLSRDFASTYMTGALGTYHWMAPQIFNNEPYSLKADVYSFGIVLWEIAARSPPYTNMKNPHSLMKFVTIENGRPDMTMIDATCPQELKLLMIQCWDRFPSNRPNFQSLLQTLETIFTQLK